MTKIITAEAQHETRDLAFAAWLVTVGVRLEDTRRVERLVHFVFEAMAETDWREHVRQWNTSEAVCNARQYADEMRHLKAICMSS